MKTSKKRCTINSLNIISFQQNQHHWEKKKTAVTNMSWIPLL